MRADAAQGANGGGVVHTQAQHIFLALAALAALASAAMPAGALPGDDGDIALTVDGSVHSHHEEQVTVPAAAPVPAQGASHAVGVRVRAYDIVLPNPAGQAYRVVGPSVTGQVVGVDDEAVSVQFQERRLAVPWYYMMDDDAVRPYHALFWDTGTAWYLGLGHDVWRSFAGPVAPEASPFAVLAPMVPELRLRTGAEEIDIGAAVGVLLQSALQPASLPSFERPDAPAGEVGSASLPADDRIAAALGSAEAPAGSARGWAPVPAAAGPALPAQAVTHQSLAAVGSIEFAAGAMGFLAGLALYHLIRKSAILKNKVRSRIAEHVLHHPGSTITEIALAVGVTHQTASYHLRLLQQHGLVLGVERGNKRLYFRNDGSFNQEERGLVAVLRDPESMRVLDLIRTNPWIMKNEAAASLGVSRNTLNWHLQKLLTTALVSEARENGHCFLFCNRKAAGEVLTQVAEKVEQRRGVLPPASVPMASLPGAPSGQAPDQGEFLLPQAAPQRQPPGA